MSEEKILSGNRLIAEFLGFYITEFNGWYHFVCKEKKRPEHINQVWEFRLEEAKYHTSWNWLMPVLEKIEGLGYGGTDIHGYDNESYCSIKEGNYRRGYGCSKSKIEATWKAVVEFINWYNLQKTKP